MHIVILTELGITVYEKDVHSYAMPFTNPSKEYLAIKQQESLPIGLAERLAKDQVGFSVTDESLMTLLKKESIDVQMVNEDYLKKVQMEKPKILVESGFASSEKDASEKLRDFAMSLSSSRITKVSSSPDLHVIQSINTLDEVDKVCNALSSRLREWYGLHFPELDNIIDGIVGYSKLVTSGRRDDLNESIFADAGFPESKVSMLKVVQEKSRGGDISDTNLAMVISLAQRMLDMLDLRKNLEDHLEKEMNIVAPNLAVILGTGVAARMLARTGSLKKLASLPASTIQVLGAERALFRSLKTGAPPPKHGILFQHALVHAAPRWQRGKIARAIAAKAVIAARVDVYGNGINPTLMEKLNIRVKEIGTKYDEAPEPRPNQDALDGNPEEKRHKDKNDFGKHRKINPENKERNGYGDDLRMERRRKNEKFKYDDSKGERGSRYRGGSKNGYRRDSAHNGFNNRRRDDDSRSGFRSQRNNDRDGFNNRRRDDDSRSGFRSHRNNDRDGFNNRRRDDDSRSGFRSHRNNDRDGFNNRRRMMTRAVDLDHIVTMTAMVLTTDAGMMTRAVDLDHIVTMTAMVLTTDAG
ncbi:MAG: snoRNA binding domain protein [Cenarchaeum symbiont of Oopsacas minuta]|nr:snoRNA binding domain protein [Cenarchaeum symbiont of Oopsacas minuta]